MENKIDKFEIDNPDQEIEMTGNLSKNTRPIFFIWQSVILILIFILFFVGISSLKQLKNIDEQQQSTNNQITTLHEEQHAIQQSIKALDKQLGSIKTQMEQTQKKVDDLTIKNSLTKEWVFNEIDAQLHKAYLTLQYSHNIPAAITLLENADTRLAKLTGPKINERRRLIINDLNALKSIPPVDVTKMLATLSSLAEEVKQLPLKKPGAISKFPTEKTPSEPTWKQQLNASFQSLEKIVTVRRLDQPIQPLLLPEQRTALEQNIQLLLQQTEWSILQRNPAVYRYSLDQITSWITRYFDQDATVTKNILNRLTELKAIDIHPNIPSLSSYSAIRNESKLE